jgi:2-polyprenyl-3-methyl-5-hydroxy-6-metoxy-1,4-benzoquinol methylase
MENLEACPVCNNPQIKNINTIQDYSVSKENFNISQCEKCETLFTNPRPDISEIGKYYQSDEYISHSDSDKGLVNKLYHIVRDITLKRKVNLINTYSSQKGKLLDIGCGTGYFLKKSKENGWKVLGTEPDEKARKIAARNTEEPILASIYEIENEKYNVITLWHVLEHIHSLQKDVSKIVNHLQKDGTLIIAVPNYQSYDADHYKNYWAAWDVPRHLYHFSPNSISKLLQKFDMEVVKQIEMPFDAFYVSLLSEKYKTGKTNLINGFINGAISNLKANNNRSSSIIYIAKNKSK